MMIDDLPPAPNSRPAARDDLAAAGPVEPFPSPDLAPGPTFSPLPRADYFRPRKTSDLVSQVRHLYRSGENYSRIARAVAVAPDTARRWLDPGYDMARRRYAMALHQPESEDSVPTLAFVPGILITGRYRMRPPT
jgi:hypothetical protein